MMMHLVWYVDAYFCRQLCNKTQCFSFDFYTLQPALLLRYTGFSENLIYDVAAIVAAKVRVGGRASSGQELHSVYKKYDRQMFFFISSKFDLPSEDDLRSP
jgi:hypothetical protein